MISLPSWFSRPAPKGGKKATTPPTSVELSTLLVQADADVAEVEARESTAAEREATERTPEAVEAYEAVGIEADRLRRFRDRLRADLEQARAREADEQCATDLAEATDIAPRVSHAGIITEATERAQRRLDLHLQLAELERDDQERRREVAALANRARSLRERHGVTDHVDDRSNLIGSDILLAELAEAHARTLPMHDARRDYLTELVHRLAPSRPAGSRLVPRQEAQA